MRNFYWFLQTVGPKTLLVVNWISIKLTSNLLVAYNFSNWNHRDNLVNINKFSKTFASKQVTVNLHVFNTGIFCIVWYLYFLMCVEFNQLWSTSVLFFKNPIICTAFYLKTSAGPVCHKIHHNWPYYYHVNQLITTLQPIRI